MKQERDEWEIMMKEEETLRKRKHPNIIPLLASFTHDTIESDCDKRSLNLIFPYAEMDMDQWMKLKQTPTWLRDHAHGRRKYLYNSMYSLVSALAFLHREIDGVITAHHDLKPENILLIGETLMISDFGRSNLIPLAQGSETNGPAGSFDYQPPEYWNDDGSRALRLHGRAFDVWAMGCIILEMATLIVHGWESEKVSQFEEERSDSSKRSRNFENKHRNDKSFHNNMNVVHNWVSRLKDHDDNSPLLSQVLMIAMAMMNIQPEERLYSWEVELDLYEILHPDDPRVVRLEKGSLGVQPPKEKDFAQRQTPLHRASIQGNRDRVSNLLKVGWLPKAKNRAGFTSIQLAKLNGNREVENLMLEHLSIRDINAEGGTLGSQIQKHFSGMGLDTGFTNLHHAARFSDAATMRLLLDQIGSAEASLVVDDFGKTPLHHAAERASEEVVSLLLAYEDPKQHLLHIKDSSGKTPLHWAAQGGNPAATQRLLLSQRATRNVLEEQDDDGKTPIELAVKYERGDVYLLLLDFKRRCSLLETPVDG